MLRRLVLVVAFALGATTGLVGCGGEDDSPNDFLNVDTVPPAAVANLEAHVLGSSEPSVQLSWSAGFEADLAGYRVYRLEAARGSGSTKRGGARIDNLELVDEVSEPRWVDTHVVMGESRSYAVSAFDMAGNESSLARTEVTISQPAQQPPPEPKTHQF